GVEVDDLVRVGAPRLPGRDALAGPLAQDLDLAADECAVMVQRLALLDLEEGLVAPLLLLLGDVVGERGGVGARPRRVLEDEGVLEADALHEGDRAVEVLGAFTGEADDEVARELDAGDLGPERLDDLEVALDGIASAHGLEDRVRPRLRGEVQVLA